MEMSINKALRELKTIAKRIETKQDNLVGLAVKTKGALVNTTMSEEEFVSAFKSDYTSLMSLIARRSTIKALINKSNANTLVTFMDKKYTVTQLIEMKQDQVHYSNIQRELMKQYKQVENYIEQNKDRVDSIIEDAINTRQSSGGQIPKDYIEDTTKTLRELNKAEVINPAENIYDDLVEFIEALEGEIDFLLTETNATTKIDVPD